ncbi:GMC family oxidoreductase [Paracoccus sp. 2205BS29-5]|uniref:GMC family oxidoreductase n=1 Tax=Paracoccus spongiarum TaxID=3064387 RepID=A0ABT9JAR3_9RHOB|nr:GMC family oxidoreductase [Paracoccus sp. 2205BS29-5]MDP5306196.1 GMC family oxidoreductase [Paracoccus sp. 2205BS29-5]
MLDAYRHRDWDVIVIGTGIGGGSAARRLAEAGLSVLMLEKGPDLDGSDGAAIETGVHDPQARLDGGVWPYPLEARIDGRESQLFGMLGACVGGTSTFYAATLERPEPHDLDDSPQRSHPTGGWPVSYAEFQPYFDQTEQNFRISGEVDPLSPVPAPALRASRPFTPVDENLRRSFERSGLHPYQTHIAAEFPRDCAQCFGKRCPRPCKMDGRSAGVLPAMRTGNAALLDRCSVTRIEAGSEVRQIHCRRDGAEFTLRARHYVLAAGGLSSPSLLLRSASEEWPDGVGNRNDLVGRNLMFHLSEMLAIWPHRGSRSKGPSRALSLRDLYHVEGQRFGLIQSMGIDAGYGEVLHALNEMFSQSRLRRLRPLRHALRLLPYGVLPVLGPAKIFVGVLEDLPYAVNRVHADPAQPDRLRFDYVLHDELRARRNAFRKAMRHAFRGHRRLFFTQMPTLNFAHPCGTLRFGDDPRSSVLDRDCRVHGIHNLVIADSSFMPTSNGCNPSLTIAANAYRAADRLAERIRQAG